MTTARTGPPGNGNGPAHHDEAATTNTHRTTQFDSTDSSAATDIVGERHRRRGASQRMVSLDCGCPLGPHADPLDCLCTQPPLTDHQLNGWKRAAEHVLADGNTPLIPLEVRRAWWRHGGSDRVLAERLHRDCGGMIA